MILFTIKRNSRYCTRVAPPMDFWPCHDWMDFFVDRNSTFKKMRNPSVLVKELYLARARLQWGECCRERESGWIAIQRRNKKRKGNPVGGTKRENVRLTFVYVGGGERRRWRNRLFGSVRLKPFAITRSFSAPFLVRQMSLSSRLTYVVDSSRCNEEVGAGGHWASVLGIFSLCPSNNSLRNESQDFPSKRVKDLWLPKHLSVLPI